MDDNKNFPTWAYGPNGQSGVFNSAEEIPTGWKDHPSKVAGYVEGSEAQGTAYQSANGSVSEAEAATTTTAQSQTALDPAKAATAGVGHDGKPVAKAPTTKAKPASLPNNTELDAHGHPYDAAVHAGTGSKTKDGLWRMKVGVKRPDPAPGYPLDL